MAELRKVIKTIEKGKRMLGPKAVSLICVKSQVRIKTNKEADKRAKWGANEEDLTFSVVMEGGLKEVWKKMRRQEKYLKGVGGRKVVKWERKARVSYIHCRTNKGNL